MRYDKAFGTLNTKTICPDLSRIDQSPAAVPMARRLRFEENVRKTLDKELKTLHAYLRLKTTKVIFMCGFLTGGVFS